MACVTQQLFPFTFYGTDLARLQEVCGWGERLGMSRGDHGCSAGGVEKLVQALCFVWWVYTVQYMLEACEMEISSGACTAAVASSPGGCSLGEPGTLCGSDNPQLLQPTLLLPRLQKQPAQR